MRRYAYLGVLPLLLLAGCGASRLVAFRAPPSPSTWPPYPQFSATSCWGRPFGEGLRREAPSFAAKPVVQPTPPKAIVDQLLARFGDKRYVLRIEVAPPAKRLRYSRGWFAGGQPPKTALWAYIASPVAAAIPPSSSTPEQTLTRMRASWEVYLVAGALRDDFCDAGGAPLVGWSLFSSPSGVSDRYLAFGQRFPSPSPAAFRRHVESVGRRYGFETASLRLLRPRELAPLLIVRTDRDRKRFVRDVPAILSLLDPHTSTRKETALLFEGFFFEARDAHGPFVAVDSVRRGTSVGGQWSWNRCVYPYAHSEPAFSEPCPR